MVPQFLLKVTSHWFFFSYLFIYLFYLLLIQGEYIAPEKIENVYLRSPFAAQVFVCGNSLKVGSIPSSKTANFIDDVI